MKRANTLLIASFFLTNTLCAQNNSVSFTISDAAKGEKLLGVALEIKGTPFGNVTDNDGKVIFKDVPAGNYNIKASFIGYAVLDTLLAISKNTTHDFNLKLVAAAEDIEEVVISSTRNGSRIEDSPTKVEVLGQEELLEENNIKPVNVSSILGDISSIQIQQTSATSGNANVRILGLDGKYTQLLRDGLPVYDGFAGNFGILQLPPLDLRQIEIIKGASSTLYGGGAIGGLINFISKRPGNDAETLLTLNQSTLQESNLNFYTASKKGKFAYTFFAGITNQNAVSVENDGFTYIPRYNDVTIHPKVFWAINKKSNLEVSVNAVFDSRKGGDLKAVENNSDANHYYYEKFDTRRFTEDAIYTLKTKGEDVFTAKAAVSYFKNDAVVVLSPANLELSQANSGMQTNYFAEATYLLHQFEKSTWVFGTALNGNHFSPYSTAYFPYDAVATGIFSQYATELFKNFRAEIGLRYENAYIKYANTVIQVGKQSISNNFLMPNIGLIYKANDNWTLRGGFGTGYKAPNPLQPNYTADGSLFSSFAPTLYADIRAEKSYGAHLEWTYKKIFADGSNLFFDQTFFGTLLTDPLFIRQGIVDEPNLFNESQNIFTRGIDNYVRAKVKTNEFYLGYTFTLPEWQKTSGSIYLPYTPLHRVSATYVYEIPEKWRFGLEASYNGVQYRPGFSKAGQTSTSDYTFLAASVLRNFGKIKVVLNAENLLDVRQQKFEPIYTLKGNTPTYNTLYAPIDGRVINLSVLFKLK